MTTQQTEPTTLTPTRSTKGLFEVPSENEYDDNIIDLPLVKTDIVKDIQMKKENELQESYKRYRNIGLCYACLILCVIILLNVVIYFSMPSCDGSGVSDSDGTNSPTSDHGLFSSSSTQFPTATMTVLPTSYPTNQPTKSSSTQSPTHSPTLTPTIQPTKSSSTQSPTHSPTITPTTSPITPSPTTTSPTTVSPITPLPTTTPSPTHGHHAEFHCGATKSDAELCQYSCAFQACPMFEYCYEVTTCTSFI